MTKSPSYFDVLIEPTERLTIFEAFLENLSFMLETVYIRSRTMTDQLEYICSATVNAF